MSYYCRRYKLNSDPKLVFKVREERYDHPNLHTENKLDDHWYWVDDKPYVEDCSSEHN